ncbi:hypothetical protein FACS189449_08110 [Alphaproteobacteria bacterium]|nr:hypothetical protein FACS189449_08110 [Alphaproteobacteria bacterium]
MVSLQKIYPNGLKKFHAGGRKKGCYFVIGEICDEVIICEGYATGASIHECIEKPVVVAFDQRDAGPIFFY